MRRFKTIKHLFNAVKSGKIDEKKLTVVIDTDLTQFFLNLNTQNEEEIEILEEGEGKNDVTALYQIAFPKASVEWC